MKFTEFIKDYVKKHPGVKYKDAVKDKKVRCLWHDHRGKEIGCPATCPPVPQERAQFNTLPRPAPQERAQLPRPASIDTPQPIREYTPPARPPRILESTRDNATRQQEVHVDADGFAISQVADAINRSYRTRAPQGQSFLSGLINTVGENLANALHEIHQAIPGDRPILGDSNWVGEFYPPEKEEFFDTNPSLVAQRIKKYSGKSKTSVPYQGRFFIRPGRRPGQLTQSEKESIQEELYGDLTGMPELEDA